jgi:hypothetical protein
LSDIFKYFKGSILFTVTGVVAAYLMGGMEAAFIVGVLAVLEISLSFDNAVVNATVLKDMDEVWRKRFLTWGIAIAVFGMRIVFPVVIVSVVSSMGPLEALDVAIYSPDVYAERLTSAHIPIMAFGGSFLMMVGLDFFLDEKEAHWIPLIEKPIVNLGHIKFAAEILTLLAIAAVAFLGLEEHQRDSFLTSGFVGVVTFTIIHKTCDLLEAREQKRASEHLVKSGFSMFIYLEILDASFSFDGVVGAFAISTNLFIIAIGLGIGAMFVRSLTIILVEKDTLTEYLYLEHGAFYAIIVLASMMFISTFYHIPEVVTGLVGAILIVLSFIHSLLENKKREKKTL